MKYDSRALLLHYSMFCVFVFVSGAVRENVGNACGHQYQRVQRKKELNQVQSCAFRQTHKRIPENKQTDRQQGG